MSIKSMKLPHLLAAALAVSLCAFGAQQDTSGQTSKSGKKAGTSSTSDQSTTSGTADSSTSGKSGKHAKGGKKTVTGCLQKGTDPSEYTITGDDGKSYTLRSSSVPLEKHVGHKVTVTGTGGGSMSSSSMNGSSKKGSSKSESADSKSGAGMSGGGNTLEVSNLKMVSTSCP